MLANSTDKEPNNPVRYHGVIHDKRTKRWRAVRELAAVLTAQAGGELSDAQRAAIDRAAELQVLSQDVRRRALASPSVEILNSLTRLENLAARALKALGTLSKPNAAPSYKDYVAAKYGPARTA